MIAAVNTGPGYRSIVPCLEAERCSRRNGDLMRIHLGCELRFEFPQTTPMIVMLNVHFSRTSELESPDYLITNPSVPIEGYRDSFGN